MAVRRSPAVPATSRAASAPPRPAQSGFAGLGVPVALADVLAARGVTVPSAIQEATLPDSLAGRDVLGRAQTGSGKTYAFLLPVLARLAATDRTPRATRPRSVILAPTRELATQIAAAAAPLAQAASLTVLTVFGGVRPGPQITGLRTGADVLVACPGRLADLVDGGHARLDDVEITVLDEADHMADLGFLPVVRRLLDRTPGTAQRLLFSATLDAGVDVLVRRYLTDPVTHHVDAPQPPAERMSHHLLHVAASHRVPVLADLAAAPGRTLVFTRTKRGATKLTRQLVALGVPAVELHGNLAQNARTRNLAAFSQGSATTMVATDIAARGIHVNDVSLVIHADPPAEYKAYLHRSGRTARAGASGTVVTIMTDDQVDDVRTLTRHAGIAPTATRVDANHPLLAELAPGHRVFQDPPPPSDRPATRSGRRSHPERTAANRSATNKSATNRSGTARSGANRSGSNHAAAQPAREEPVSSTPPRSSGMAAFSASSRAGARRRGR